jgi:hypothetical protein
MAKAQAEAQRKRDQGSAWGDIFSSAAKLAPMMM